MHYGKIYCKALDVYTNHEDRKCVMNQIVVFLGKPWMIKALSESNKQSVCFKVYVCIHRSVVFLSIIALSEHVCGKTVFTYGQISYTAGLWVSLCI